MMKPDCNAEIKAYGDEEMIWECLVELTPNEQIAAGIMGFMYRESRLKADAVAGWNIRPEGTCEAFVAEVDGGMEKDEFVRRVQDYGGFGLGQWVSYDYLESLYDYMKTHEYSIADVRGQCEFAIASMMENETLWEDLLTCNTAIQCGRRIGYRYDCTDYDGSEAIAAFADYFYRHLKEE